MGVAVVIVALIAFMGFKHWLQLQRRMMIHRERLVALEKGIAVPALEPETSHTSWTMQRVLLLAGLIWMSLGVATFVVLSELIAFAVSGIPRGLQFISIAPVGIGLSHLIVYFLGRKQNSAAFQSEQAGNKAESR